MTRVFFTFTDFVKLVALLGILLMANMPLFSQIDTTQQSSYTARIGNQKTGRIKASLLQANRGIIVDSKDLNIAIPVTRFIMKIVRNNYTICTISSEGGRFTETIQSEFTKLKPRDQIYFEDIYALLPESDKEQKLNKIDFIIE